MVTFVKAATLFTLFVCAVAAEDAEDTTEESRAFLAAHAKEDGVTVLPSGLQYRIIESGSGPRPERDTPCQVEFKGTLIDDDTVFDGRATTLSPSQALPGLTEAMLLMNEGSRWRLVLPPHLAFGNVGTNGVNNKMARVRPGDAVIFDLLIVKVRVGETAAEGFFGLLEKPISDGFGGFSRLHLLLVLVPLFLVLAAYDIKMNMRRDRQIKADAEKKKAATTKDKKKTKKKGNKSKSSSSSSSGGGGTSSSASTSTSSARASSAAATDEIAALESRLAELRAQEVAAIERKLKALRGKEAAGNKGLKED